MNKDPLIFWRLADRLSVVDASILICGGNPELTDTEDNGFGNQLVDVKRTTGYAGYTAVFSALKNALISGKLNAQFFYLARNGVETGDPFEEAERYFHLISTEELDFEPHPTLRKFKSLNGVKQVFVSPKPDWDRTMILVDDLRTWLASRGLTEGFFFPERTKAVEGDFMDPNHDRFAPELALAVKAWRALEHEQSLKGGVKGAVKRWIDENQNEWGELDGRGKELQERIATVINWRKNGGASTT